ncbi:MAG: hypothetical protein GDA44_13300 [Prochloron sp. SP5CPC1]|nr:hypothetical protein [Candidatus Paraprochloron terpiosi SP5CPC1]
MSYPGGVAALGTKRTPESFSTTEQKIDLKIEHDFWKHTTTYPTDGWISSWVTVTNTGDIVLKDIKIYVDVDDDSDKFDAHLCESGGNIIQECCLKFGDLAPGVSSSKQTYLWIVKPVFPDVQGSATKTVGLILYPMFTADFRQSGKLFRSDSALDKA